MAEFPKSLFKYCSKKVFEENIQHGELQFGRASYYRKAYENGHSFGDKYESLPTYEVFEETFIDGRKNPQNFFSFMNPPGGDRGVVMFGTMYMSKGNTFSVEQPDSFILSLSKEYNLSAHRKFFETDGYDLCVKITNIEEMIRRIYVTIEQKLDAFVDAKTAERDSKFWLRADDVTYTKIPSNINARQKIGSFYKDVEKFDHEHEYRIELLFRPDIVTPNQNFLRLSIPSFGQLIEIHKDLSSGG